MSPQAVAADDTCITHEENVTTKRRLRYKFKSFRLWFRGVFYHLGPLQRHRKSFQIVHFMTYMSSSFLCGHCFMQSASDRPCLSQTLLQNQETPMFHRNIPLLQEIFHFSFSIITVAKLLCIKGSRAGGTRHLKPSESQVRPD